MTLDKGARGWGIHNVLVNLLFCTESRNFLKKLAIYTSPSISTILWIIVVCPLAVMSIFLLATPLDSAFWNHNHTIGRHVTIYAVRYTRELKYIYFRGFKYYFSLWQQSTYLPRHSIPPQYVRPTPPPQEQYN